MRRAASLLALAGGAVLLSAATLTCVSVVLRWLTSQPVRGDFELVSLGSGLAVLGFLAWGTYRRANIIVDSFTTWLPARLADWVDAFWSLVWAAVTLLIAERMARGAMDTWASGTRTIGLLALPYWWAVAVGAFCFALTGLAALLVALRLARG
ncbi:TRAP transporter small permease [Sabulicella glaciei]|uniref:TRAP transporter small permease protein n=1 Tax=Sabulicella glaciei TaxID=2984948 RepID=A0ABT3NQK1_9PROT|nr:TRAP transporter small permease subunit [Roseococcus sp. MDT2-1-1]MCW8084434.1 TRAP transporter small permease [Roseococcus sp. MDT2-1-1]